MPDMEKVIKGLNDIGGFIAGRVGFEQARNFLRTIDDAITLLKEQDNCENCVIAIEDRQRVVRCKDCKHWYFADNRIPSEQENVCGRNGTVVTPDWFCADGERR